MITRQQIADELLKYLRHKRSLLDLVDWAERQIIEGEFEPGKEQVIREALGKLAAADSEEFGLLWEDCEELMHKLGYTIKVEVDKAA